MVSKDFNNSEDMASNSNILENKDTINNNYQTSTDIIQSAKITSANCGTTRKRKERSNKDTAKPNLSNPPKKAKLTNTKRRKVDATNTKEDQVNDEDKFVFNTLCTATGPINTPSQNVDVAASITNCTEDLNEKDEVNVSSKNARLIPEFIKRFIERCPCKMSSTCSQKLERSVNGVCQLCRFPEQDLVIKMLEEFETVSNTKKMSLSVGLSAGGITTSLLTLQGGQKKESFCSMDAFMIGIVVRGVGKLHRSTYVKEIDEYERNAFYIESRSYYGIINDNLNDILKILLIHGRK